MRTESAPAYRPASASPAVTPGDPFETELRRIARALRESVPNLTAREQEFLYDLAREEARYPMPTVRKICRLARRSSSVEAREAFAELIRAESSHPDALPVDKAFDLECPVPGVADVAQRQFETNPNPITWARCKDALYRQFVVSRAALQAVLAARPNGVERSRASG